MIRFTSASIALVSLLGVLLCDTSSCFVVSPSRSNHNRATPVVGTTSSSFASTTSSPRFNPTLLQASNYNGQDFQDDIKRLGKVTGRAARSLGKAALQGLGAGIRGAKNIAQDQGVQKGVDTLAKGVNEGVKGIKNLVGETQQNEQVQKGVERLKNLVDKSQKRVQETLKAKTQKSTFDNEQFDTEDEQLFRDIPKKRPEVIVDAEILEGVRVIGGTADRRVIDAEVITKTWNR